MIHTTPTPSQPGKPKANMGANGQAVNKGSLLSGLTRDSGVKANTGTATGDRAVQDMAKAKLYQNQANFGRQAETDNAKTHAQQQMQQEAMTQQMRQAHMQRFQQQNQQATSQQQLGMNLQQQSYMMWLDRQRGLASLLS